MIKNWRTVTALLAVVLFVVLAFTYEYFSRFDTWVAQLLQGSRLLGMIEQYGTKVIIVLAIGVIVLLIVQKNRRLLLFVIAGVAAELAVNKALKNIIGRLRPDTAVDATSYSFPSGHTMFSFVTLLLLAYAVTRYVGHARLLVWLVAVLFAVATGLSRVAAGQHFMTDVLAGWVLSYAIVLAVIVLYERKEPLS